LAQDASLRPYIVTAQVYPSLILQQISLTLYGHEQFAAFCLFVMTLPIDFALLGRKQKYVSKITAKLKGIQTLIAVVRDQFLSFATFPIPLLSRYRLPLRLETKVLLIAIVEAVLCFVFGKQR
jgi:hypothetical protein